MALRVYYSNNRRNRTRIKLMQKIFTDFLDEKETTTGQADNSGCAVESAAGPAAARKGQWHILDIAKSINEIGKQPLEIAKQTGV